MTFLPLYLQVVKNSTPSEAGMQLLPMMCGLMLTSIVSGRLISKIGKYRVFPIVGTLLACVAMGLLATLNNDTSVWLLYMYICLLGMGLGMVMQVLILAVQNSVDFKYMGVATSGATLFRSIGGSIGVAAFGALFTNQLHTKLADTFRTMPSCRIRWVRKAYISCPMHCAASISTHSAARCTTGLHGGCVRDCARLCRRVDVGRCAVAQAALKRSAIKAQWLASPLRAVGQQSFSIPRR
jgi:MFS family permease